MKTLEIIAMVYKSVIYVEFIIDQIKKFSHDFDDIKVSYRIIANDPYPQVEEYLVKNNIPHDIYHDPKPDDYYLNRVYRCWNYGGATSNADLICFVNSDDAFCPGWLEALYEAHQQNYLPASRLIESGKIQSGKHAIMKNFGRHPDEFDQEGWLKFVEQYKSPAIELGGLYMPCLFDRKEFIDAGLYPEGNIYNNGVGTCNGRTVIAGDAYFFIKFEKLTGRKHATPFKSMVYHIQEGEKDSPKDSLI